MATTTREVAKTLPESEGPHHNAGSRGLRIAFILSGLIAALMVAASLAGLLVDGLYRDGPWAREALWGGDLTTLALAAPVLLWAWVRSRRGSERAKAIWIGALAYSVYNYTYYAFGAVFNDVFVVHVALLALSIWAGALVAVSVDLGAIARAFDPRRAAGWVGGFLVLVGVILGGLWIVLSVRQAITGELMADVPTNGIHLVFAVDLALLVPALVVAGVLLWRRTQAGIVFGVAMAVMGSLYQVNLLLAGVFQANADVPGAKALPVEGVVVAIGFVISLALLVGRRPSQSLDERDRENRRNER